MTPSEDLFKLTGVGVVQTDMGTGRFLQANQTFCEMVGYSEAELRGMTNAELTHPDDWQRDGERFAALQAGELQEDQAITRVLHRDGHEVWLELNITIMGEGEQVVNLTLVNDVTERKRAEEALRESELRLQLALEAANMGTFLYHIEEDRGEPDARMLALFGLPEGDELNLAVALAELIHPDDRAGYAEAVARATDPAGDGRLQSDIRVIHPGNEIRWVSVMAQVMLEGEPRRPVDMYGTAIDISERKQQEERQAFLLRFADTLRAEPDADTVATLAVQMLADELRPDRCYIVARRREEDLWDVGPEFRLPDLPGMPPVLDQREFPESLRLITQGTLVFDNAAEQPGVTDLERKGLQALGFGGLLMAVLREGERNAAWAMVVSSRQPRRWTSTEIKLIEDVAERTWAAVERAKAEASLAELNETLAQQVKARTQELERSNVRFTQAFTLAPYAATISTLDKHETFIEVNDAFLELARYKREEIIGKTAFDLKMWSSRQDQRKLDEAQKDGLGFRDLALQLKDSEGNLLDILLSAEVIRIDGHHGYLKMFYDVTEKKRNDEQMMLAVDSVITQATWFSQEFIARLNHIRSGGRIEDYQPLALTQREREVVQMVARGWTNKRISEELGLKQQTIRNYLSSIFDKIGVHSRTEAAVWARERGLIA